MTSQRIYSDDELRHVLAGLDNAQSVTLDAVMAKALVVSVRNLLRQRDEARERCIELLGSYMRRLREGA